MADGQAAKLAMSMPVERGLGGHPGQTSLLGDHSEREPPDPIPNSEVKPLSADDSVAVCHVKVGNRQAPNDRPHPEMRGAFFLRVAIS